MDSTITTKRQTGIILISPMILLSITSILHNFKHKTQIQLTTNSKNKRLPPRKSKKAIMPK